VITALSICGFSADRFLFLGFLPRKGTERRQRLAQVAASEVTVVLFEAPSRLSTLLSDLAESAGPERRAMVGRELTKLHEETRAGALADLAAFYREPEPRGECTVVVEGTGTVIRESDPEAARSLASRLLASGITRREAARQLALETGLSRNDAYRLVMELS
jgi:16S rRNA (cytidine1402-2'-O)-methyltransferase